VIEMIDFWLLITLLLVAGLSFLWWPVFMRRRQSAMVSRQQLNVQAFETQVADLASDLQAGRIDDEQFSALKIELERNLLGDVKQAGDPRIHAEQGKRPSVQASGLTAMLLSAVLIAGVFGFYLSLGSSDTLQKMASQQALVHKLSELSAEERLAVLEQEADKNPEQVDIWYALANIYFQQNRLEKTQYAYDQLLALVGEDPVLLAEYAQILFFMNGNKMSTDVTSIAERALAVDPRNLSALGLMGISAFESGNYSKAIAAWQTALSVAPDAQGAEALEMGIERARKLMAETPQAEGGAQLIVSVSLDETLLAQTKPDQVVFVLARATSGPKMPLAAHRIRVKDLPATVILNDDMAMRPELKLSSVDEVEVLARVSMSGQPIAQAGDLQGQFRPVNVNSEQGPIELVIDHIIE